MNMMKKRKKQMFTLDLHSRILSHLANKEEEVDQLKEEEILRKLRKYLMIKTSHLFSDQIFH